MTDRHPGEPYTRPADPRDEDRPQSTRRRRSSLSLSSRIALEHALLLDSVQVKYPLHEIDSTAQLMMPPQQRLLMAQYLDMPAESQTLIARKKYATNVDDRSFLSVYEYQINDQWIIWDYFSGYVFFTGLWKACGNKKTDIVKLVENIPSLESCVVRVRGGFLKIQGTWLPYHKVRELAKNFCYNIRYCLIPLFGSQFPDECLKPGDLNYGRLIDVNAPLVVRYRRRSSQTAVNRRQGQSSFTPKQRRSHSDSLHNNPIIEMEEMLKASKQLHELSGSSTSPVSMDIPHLQKRSSSFNYGGFIWSWHENNNLKFLGKEHPDVFDDMDTAMSRDAHSSSSVSSPHGYTFPSDASLSDMTPKCYDPHETDVNAAHQLVHFSTPLREKVINRGKMDINGLLSSDT